jgi:hypothetical protein
MLSLAEIVTGGNRSVCICITKECNIDLNSEQSLTAFPFYFKCRQHFLPSTALFKAPYAFQPGIYEERHAGNQPMAQRYIRAACAPRLLQ